MLYPATPGLPQEGWRYTKHFVPFESVRHSSWHRSRQTPRVLAPADFLSLLRKHKTPYFNSCGIDRNRWGERSRHDFAMPASGTLWFANPQRRANLFQVPANWLPYTSIQDIVLSSRDGTRLGGEFTKGWRAVLHDLTEQGYLQPSAGLSLLIGEDSHALNRRFGGFEWETPQE